MKAQVYSDVGEKKIQKEERPLSPVESLIRCLDVLDFNRALSEAQKFTPKKKDDGITWIELSFRKK